MLIAEHMCRIEDRLDTVTTAHEPVDVDRP